VECGGLFVEAWGKVWTLIGYMEIPQYYGEGMGMCPTMFNAYFCIITTGVAPNPILSFTLDSQIRIYGRVSTVITIQSIVQTILV
jgi:hypothetical protein